MLATLARKSITDVRIKDAEQGIVEAVIATLGVKDRDGDVAYKSAFTDGAAVVISAYGHKSWEGALPVGYGVLKVSDTEAVVEAQFLMDTTHGRDTFLTVKELGSRGLQEWSYSLQNVKSHRGEVNGEKVNVLDSIEVKEASPVLVGAGIGTRNLSSKGFKQLDSDLRRNLRAAGQERWADDDTWVWTQDFDVDESFAIYEIEGNDEYRLVQVDFTRNDDGSVTLADNESDVQQVTSYAPKSAKFSEQTDSALRGVKQLVEMAVERLTHRAAEGKAITEQINAHDQLVAELVPLKQAIDATQEAPSSEDAEADDQFAHALVASLIAQGAPS